MILISLLFGIIFLTANLSNSNFYSYFFDEFYYLDCAKNLSFGYVDHPPFSIFILFIWTNIFGTTLISIRVLMTLISAIIIFVTGRTASKLGGGIFSQILSSISVMTIPVFMMMTSYYSMNVIEILICCLCFYTLITIIKDNKPELWILIGVMTGIGLENKHTFLIYIISILIGLMLTRDRKYFLSIWFLIGIITAAVLMLPNLIWQYMNNWPSLEFYSHITNFSREYKLAFYQILLTLVMLYNPVLFPIWSGGLFFLFFTKEGKAYRVIGWALIPLVFILLISRTVRVDRIASIFPVLLAAGSILLEKILIKKYLVWIKPIVIIAVVLSGLFFVPVYFPVLKLESASVYFFKYAYKNRVTQLFTGNLEYALSAKTGWEENVKRIAGVYNKLPGEEKNKTGIICFTFGQAGAINLLGKKYNLPDCICVNNSYYLWGQKKDFNYEELIVAAPEWMDEAGVFGRFQGSVNIVDCVVNNYAPGFLRVTNLYIIKNINFKLKTVWPSLKMYN
jgi:4-amino-4-deoxy-L-arabinose transferase-like glycosyltransferase